MMTASAGGVPPRTDLGFFPTPLVELRRLSQRLGGPRLLMKRDDQSGLALGGNKTRKLEFLMGAALAEGCDTLVTGGAAQSNHCRQTAAAAAACGLACHLVLGGAPPAEPTGNLLLDRLFGATLHWAGPCRKGETIPELVAELRRAGRRPYLIPYGGSSPVGALGFVAAAAELKAQLAYCGEISHILFASSSGGTQAGLMVGARRHGLGARLLGIAIDKGEAGEGPFAEHVRQLAAATAQLLGMDGDVARDEVLLEEGYVGAGYGVVGPLERRAIRLTAETEGILLDPVYTGRAMGALIDLIERGALTPKQSVLFWHTGGAPALFAYGGTLLPE